MTSSFVKALEERILIGDGAMGTRVYEKGVQVGQSFDELNLTTSHLVSKIHQEYIAAGSDFIETNTFTANRLRLKKYGLESKVREINEAGAKIAREVAGKEIFVAGSVGPLTGAVREEEDAPEDLKYDIFAEQIEAQVAGGVDAIILETFTDLKELKIALQVVRDKTKLPVICLMTFGDQLRTLLGVHVQQALAALEKEKVEVIGANCTIPLYTERVITYMGTHTQTRLASFSNAGLPEYVDGRYLYKTTPDYFARMGMNMAKAGANLIGGCCGTGIEHIRSLAAKMKGTRPFPRSMAARKSPETKIIEVVEPAHPSKKKTFAHKLGRQKMNVVELDPPRGLNYKKVLQGAIALHKAGADAITVGDNPLAVLRMGNIGMAHLMEQEGVPTVAHISCRDKNLIALQSTVMEAAALGITSLLPITGDPAKVGDQPKASSVYDLNSFELIKLIANMNRGRNYSGNSIQKKTRFKIGGAFNPNVQDMDRQVRRLKKKIDCGLDYALPQPLYDMDRVETMYKSIREGVGDFPVFFGVCPAVSERNAEFLANEVPGITVPEDVIERLRKTPEAKQRAEGLKIAKELIDKALEFDPPGFYIIPPFSSVEISLELLDHIQSRVKAKA